MKNVALIENSPLSGSYFDSLVRDSGGSCSRVGAWRGAPLPRDFDACILTGDMHNVTDGLKGYHQAELDLIDRLEGRKLYASCFSHQLIAHHFGGKVVRRGSRLLGWEAVSLSGYHPVVRGREGFEAVCMNVDEVAEAPKAAEVLGSSDGCAFQVLAYGDNILTCQSHPEFSFERGSWMVKAVALVLSKGPGAGYRRFRESGPALWPRDSEFMRGVIEWLLV